MSKLSSVSPVTVLAPAPDAAAEAPSPGVRKHGLAAGAATAALALVAGLWWALQPALRIESVRSAQAVLVADGRPQPVVLRYDSRHTRPRRVEVRWVEGSARWPASSWQIPVDVGAQSKGEVSAGPLSHRSATPVRATFEYTLLDHEGRRSPPVQKSLEFLPPVTVTEVRFATPPRAGQNTLAQVFYSQGAGHIVAVQHKVIESTTPWAVAARSAAPASDTTPGRVALALNPPTQAARSTLEVVLVDSLGVKSEPFVFALDTGLQPIRSEPARAASVKKAAPADGPLVVGPAAGGLAGAKAAPMRSAARAAAPPPGRALRLGHGPATPPGV